MSDEILNNKDIKRNVPRWVMSFCATLMFLSVFINSIGLNLMQINGALTESIVKKINGIDESEGLKKEIERLNLEVEKLKKLSHKKSTKH